MPHLSKIKFHLTQARRLMESYNEKSIEDYAKYSFFKMTRKPSLWGGIEILDYNDCASELDSEEAYEFHGLIVEKMENPYTAKYLWPHFNGELPSTPLEKFNKDVSIEGYFVLKTKDDDYYLVDASGYSYLRYVVKLENF